MATQQPYEHNFTIVRGFHFIQQFTVGPLNQVYFASPTDLFPSTVTATNITGATFSLEAKIDPESASATIQLLSTGGSPAIVLTTPSSGLITCTFTPTITSTPLARREYSLPYELKMTLSSKDYSLLRGTLRILPNVVG